MRLLVVIAAARGAVFNESSRRHCTEAELEHLRTDKNAELHEVLSAVHGPRCGGFFIESGANNGRNSVTRNFEGAGWRGICVEPSPVLFQLLQRYRPLCENHNVALFGERREMVYRERGAAFSPEAARVIANGRYGGALKDHSGLEEMRTPKLWAKMEAAHPNASRRDHTILARPVDDVLGGARNHVDLYSLDVEGAELSILEHFPFDKIVVELWFVETNKLDRVAFVAFMESKGYSCHHYDHVNSLCQLNKHRFGHHGTPPA